MGRKGSRESPQKAALGRVGSRVCEYLAADTVGRVGSSCPQKRLCPGGPRPECPGGSLSLASSLDRGDPALTSQVTEWLPPPFLGSFVCVFFLSFFF